jgi:hypothetical protein
MPLHAVPRRSFIPQPAAEPSPINWRRGMFRVWVLVSGSWIMSWSIYLIVNTLEGGFKASDVLVFPVLLFGPPVAFLIFGAATGWAFRGFRVDRPTEQP